MKITVEKITFEGKPEELEKLLDAIGGSKEQLIVGKYDVNKNIKKDIKYDY